MTPRATAASMAECDHPTSSSQPIGAGPEVGSDPRPSMTTRPDLLAQLADLADDLGPLAVPTHWQDQLRGICSTSRLVLAAAAVSVARVEDDEVGGLEYVAADGEGAAQIEGTRLGAGEGLAGFVVASGQSLAIDRVTDDPRFAATVAESTGYVPTSMLVVPVTSAAGTPMGVLSVLDRGTETAVTSADALEVAGSFARQAALVLPQVELLFRLGPVLVRAVADAVAAEDDDLATGLRRVADDLSPTDSELARTAALLGELRSRDPATRASVERVLGELVTLTAPRRRR